MAILGLLKDRMVVDSAHKAVASGVDAPGTPRGAPDAPTIAQQQQHFGDDNVVVAGRTGEARALDSPPTGSSSSSSSAGDGTATEEAAAEMAAAAATVVSRQRRFGLFGRAAAALDPRKLPQRAAAAGRVAGAHARERLPQGLRRLNAGLRALPLPQRVRELPGRAREAAARALASEPVQALWPREVRLLSFFGGGRGLQERQDGSALSISAHAPALRPPPRLVTAVAPPALFPPPKPSYMHADARAQPCQPPWEHKPQPPPLANAPLPSNLPLPPQHNLNSLLRSTRAAPRPASTRLPPPTPSRRASRATPPPATAQSSSSAPPPPPQPRAQRSAPPRAPRSPPRRRCGSGR